MHFRHYTMIIDNQNKNGSDNLPQYCSIRNQCILLTPRKITNSRDNKYTSLLSNCFYEYIIIMIADTNGFEHIIMFLFLHNIYT